MTDPILIAVFLFLLIFGGIVGFFFASFRSKGVQNLISERNKELNQQFLDACKEREEIRNTKDLLNTRLTERNSEYKNLQQKLEEQKTELEKLQEKFSKDFEILANKILEQKSEKFTSLNKENIEQILHPLQEKIKTFEEKVEKNSNESIERHAALGQQLQYLHTQNIKISEEANNLTRALKGDTQKQGKWGEIILESVLEKSGLRKDSEYFIQQSLTSDEGKKLRPDVIINLPGDKKLIVDSKVSLNAYERYCSEEEETQKTQYLVQHLKAIRGRIEELSQKNYQNLYEMESPDFVLLFIPIEAAFALASHKNPELYSDAFEKNIILVTPTTLLAVLRTIDSMWQNEKQKQNAVDIATQAGRLYDSFTTLTDELLKVGRQMNTVQNSYEGIMRKLTGKGNLLMRVERLRELGAKTSKQMDQKLVARAYPSDEDSDQ